MWFCKFYDDIMFRGNFVASVLEDSGVDVNSPTRILQGNVLNQGTANFKVERDFFSVFSWDKRVQLFSAKVTQPVKPRKRKSVTFSDTLVNGSEDSSQREKVLSEVAKVDDVNKDSQEDYSQIFRVSRHACLFSKSQWVGRELFSFA